MRVVKVGKKGLELKVSKNQLIQMTFRADEEDIMIYGEHCCMAFDSWDCLYYSLDKKKAIKVIDDVTVENI